MTCHNPDHPSDPTDYDYGLGLPKSAQTTLDPENLSALVRALEAELGFIRFHNQPSK